jgi:MraZ protein
MFFGEHDHTLDDKGRLTIPARYRDLLINGAYITLGFDDNLIVMRSEDFNLLYHKLEELSEANSAARKIRRTMFGKAVFLEFDRNGRVLVPQFLREMVKIDNAVKLVGTGRYIEIWSPEVYKETQADIEDGEERARMFEAFDITFKTNA